MSDAWVQQVHHRSVGPGECEYLARLAIRTAEAHEARGRTDKAAGAADAAQRFVQLAKGGGGVVQVHFGIKVPGKRRPMTVGIVGGGPGDGLPFLCKPSCPCNNHGFRDNRLFLALGGPTPQGGH